MLKEKGFTLIELLLTIALITLLSGAVLTATGASRTEAKNVKVKTEIKQIERSLESHDVSVGGYPNPEPGEKKLYCVGSTECLLNNKVVSTYINPLTGATSATGAGETYKYTDLISFRNEAGEVTKGYMYMSCGDESPVCNDPNSVVIIYPQSGANGSYYSNLSTNSSQNSFNETALGITDSSYTAGSGDQGGDTFACDASYQLAVWNQATTPNNPTLLSSSCSFNEMPASYTCSVDCNTASTEFANEVNAVYPYPYSSACQPSWVTYRCVNYHGSTVCNYTNCD